MYSVYHYIVQRPSLPRWQACGAGGATQTLPTLLPQSMAVRVSAPPRRPAQPRPIPAEPSRSPARAADHRVREALKAAGQHRVREDGWSQGARGRLVTGGARAAGQHRVRKGG
jgi:hypothetical protein